MNFENPSCASTDDLAGPTNYVAGNLKTLVRNTDVDNELIEIGMCVLVLPLYSFFNLFPVSKIIF